MEPRKKYNFTLVEIRDSNKEFTYKAYISNSPDEEIPEFMDRVKSELDYNPDSDNYSNVCKYGKVDSITTRKTTMCPVNAHYVHFLTGSYGLLGFASTGVLFEQDKLLSQMKPDDERSRMIQSVQVKII
jgi:hypothetical protein